MTTLPPAITPHDMIRVKPYRAFREAMSANLAQSRAEHGDPEGLRLLAEHLARALKHPDNQAAMRNAEWIERAMQRLNPTLGATP